MLEICLELRENFDFVVKESCQCKKWSLIDFGVKFYDFFFFYLNKKILGE